MTIAKVEETRKRLEKELADAEAERKELNDSLINQAGDIRSDPKEAEKIGARIVAIDARIVAVKAALTRNDQQAGLLQAKMKTKEYKDGVKQRDELPKFFEREADEIHAEIVLLRERLQIALDKRAEYMSLIDRYGLELSEDRKMALRSNKDIGYLIETNALLNQQAWREERLKGLQTISAEIVERNKRPAEVKPASKFRINFWESHYTDSDGKPVMQGQNA